jgi:enoyl-CoA hydratase/carnithine racemase
MPVHTEQRGRVLLITLDRPEKMNALNQELMEGLSDAWKRVDADDDIWVAILTGAGDRAFCSGRDLFAGTQGSWEYHRDRLERGEKIEPRELRYTPDGVKKPVIAAVNGYSLAGGFALALACDIRIAADTARIGSMAVKRNLLGGGQIIRLTRYIPFAKALELLLLGDHISAAEAERIGLVNKVVPQGDLLPTAFEWAEKICQNGPLAVRATKEAAYKGGLEMPFRDATRLEGELYNRMLETEDVQEGHAAFRERREPVWKGR